MNIFIGQSQLTEDFRKDAKKTMQTRLVGKVESERKLSMLKYIGIFNGLKKKARHIWYSQGTKKRCVTQFLHNYLNFILFLKSILFGEYFFALTNNYTCVCDKTLW